METYYTRLDKSGEHVLCGRQHADCTEYTCHQEIAVVCPSRKQIQARRASTPDDRDLEFYTQRWVQFPEGWAPGPDGVWRLANYSKKRIRHGLEARYRSPIRKEAPLGQAPRDFIVGGSLDTVVRTPVRVKCPKCDLEQTLDPSVHTA